jgi:hypothetical protein
VCCIPTRYPRKAYTKCVSAAMVVNDLTRQLKCATLLPDTPENAYTKCVSSAMVVNDLKAQLRCASLLSGTHPIPPTPCSDTSKPDASGQCPPQLCERPDSTAKVDADKDLKTINCDKDDKNELTSPPPTKIVRVISHGVSSGGSNNNNDIVVIPSKPNDFANKDPSTLTVEFVHATGPDSIGNYYVKGEVMSTTPALNNLKITAHWFDSSNKLIGVTFAYADELDLNFGDRSTFSVLANGHTDLTGIPKSVELSYDWQ